MMRRELSPSCRTGRALTLFETAISVAPAMAAIYIGEPSLAAALLFGVSGVFLTLHALARQPAQFTALAVGLVPPVMLIRNQFYFSSLVVFFATGLTLWWMINPDDVRELFSSLTRRLLMYGTLVYWLISWANTGFYSVNIHCVELALTASCIFLLGKDRYWLATALLAMAISVFCVGGGAFPYGDRLGLIVMGHMSFGNPISLGSAAGLVFLLCTAEGGRWIGLERRFALRFAIALVSTAVLVMSTSRGSWLMAIAGFVTALATDRKHRFQVLSFTVLIAFSAITGALSTGRAGAVIKYVDKVSSSDRTVSQKTTGRFDQWEQLPAAMATSPLWGHGGGSGAEVYAELGNRVLEWHSLYLQLLVETGVIGFSFMAGLLVATARGAFRHWVETSEVVPLQTLVCYCVVGVSISAFDSVSGIILGLALLGNDRRGQSNAYVAASMATGFDSTTAFRPAPLRARA